MANFNKRVPENVPGEFFVDFTCIDCDTCRQLAPDSDLLTRLNVDETPDGPAWVSVWTTQDQVVTPPESARLDGAVNIPVQGVCPGAVVAHGELPTDRVVQALVLAALAPGPPPTPTAADCRRLSA